MGLNLAFVHALEINLDAEVGEGLGHMLAWHVIHKSSRCIKYSSESSELKGIFPVASFYSSGDVYKGGIF